MAPSSPLVLILNASLNGAAGNTAAVLQRAESLLQAAGATPMQLVLAEGVSYREVRARLQQASAVVIGTGTHWDSWSSHLQAFLEQSTVDEGTYVWLGKPAAVFVTEHSVGGKSVLSRLLGVLNTLGCRIPPMGGLVYSFANQTALRNGLGAVDDLWCLEDIEIVCHNLAVSLGLKSDYRAWWCDREGFRARWIDPV